MTYTDSYHLVLPLIVLVAVGKGNPAIFKHSLIIFFGTLEKEHDCSVSGTQWGSMNIRILADLQHTENCLGSAQTLVVYLNSHRRVNGSSALKHVTPPRRRPQFCMVTELGIQPTENCAQLASFGNGKPKGDRKEKKEAQRHVSRTYFWLENPTGS
ncbi:hypothetical protein DFS33DRAFT_217682 [Desarmillaria ectypa]|nr:hypothetical protein DFS33DRAFT_217682 [Desarmillaria ectypa]